MHRTPLRLSTPMSHPTSHEVLALIVGPRGVAGLQRITVQIHTMRRLVLQNPAVFFPRNAHPHRMLGGVQGESYCIFLDVGVHNGHSDDCVYVIVKVEPATRAPLDVDPDTVLPKVEILLRKSVHHLLCYHDEIDWRPM